MSGTEIPRADIVWGSVPTLAFVRDLWISLSLYFVQVVEQLKRSSVCAFSQTSELAISFGSEVVMLSYDTNEKRGEDQLSAGSSLLDSLVVPSSSRPASAAMTHASADSSLAPPSGLSKAEQFYDAATPPPESAAVPACPVPGIPRNATEASTEPTEGQSADVPAPSGLHQALTGPACDLTRPEHQSLSTQSVSQL